MKIRNPILLLISLPILLHTPGLAAQRAEHQGGWNVASNALLKPGAVYTGIELVRALFEYRNLPSQTPAQRALRAKFLQFAFIKATLVGFTVALANYVNLGAEYWVLVDGQTQLTRLDDERRHRLIEAFGDAGTESALAFKEGNHGRAALIIAKHLWQLTHAFTWLEAGHPDLKLVSRAFQVPWKAELGAQHLTFSQTFVADVWAKLGLYVPNEQGNDESWKQPYLELINQLLPVEG